MPPMWKTASGRDKSRTHRNELFLKLDGFIEHAVEAEKDRDLDKHWQTTAERIDAVLFVQLHGSLIHPLGIVFVLREASFMIGETAILRIDFVAAFWSGQSIDRMMIVIIMMARA